MSILSSIHRICPVKSTDRNTTFGVSCHAKHHPRFRSRPRSHRCRCYHPDLLRLFQDHHHCGSQCLADACMPPERSKCLRYEWWLVASSFWSSKLCKIVRFNCCVPPWNGLGSLIASRGRQDDQYVASIVFHLSRTSAMCSGAIFSFA